MTDAGSGWLLRMDLVDDVDGDDMRSAQNQVFDGLLGVNGSASDDFWIMMLRYVKIQDFCSASEDQETELLRMFSEAWAGCIGRVKSCSLFEVASIRLHTRYRNVCRKPTEIPSDWLKIGPYLPFQRKAQAFFWSVRRVYPALNIHGTAPKSPGELDKSININTLKLGHLPLPWCNIKSPSTGVDPRNLFFWGHGSSWIGPF